MYAWHKGHSTTPSFQTFHTPHVVTHVCVCMGWTCVLVFYLISITDQLFTEKCWSVWLWIFKKCCCAHICRCSCHTRAFITRSCMPCIFFIAALVTECLYPVSGLLPPLKQLNIISWGISALPLSFYLPLFLDVVWYFYFYSAHDQICHNFKLRRHSCVCLDAGGGGEEAQSLFGLQLSRASKSNLLRQLWQLHGAPALAQTRCQGIVCLWESLRSKEDQKHLVIWHFLIVICMFSSTHIVPAAVWLTGQKTADMFAKNRLRAHKQESFIPWMWPDVKLEIKTLSS